MKSVLGNALCHLSVGSLLLASQSAAAVSIVFDYSYDTNGFFSDASRRAVLEQAGSQLGARLGDSLQAINSSGSNNFTAMFANPGSGATEQISNYSVAADTLVVYAGGRAMGAGQVGEGGPGGFSASGSAAFLETAQARGQSGALASAPTDFGPWGGSLSFDTGTDWYFDADPSTAESFTGNDFYSVALHELGHVLGFGTAESWETWVSGGEFTGPNSVNLFGGNVALSGDLGHWMEGTLGNVDGMTQETAMDPNVLVGTRKLFTDLDYAGLQDVGWEVTPVPVPPAAILLASGLIGLLRLRRSA